MKTQAEVDRYFMELALKEARQAYDEGEIPIGAVVVSKTGRLLGRGHNLTETLADVTAHAEMQAISAAAQSLGGKYLTDCTLYVTVEPCLMCAGAIAWAQISRIVYGTSDSKRGYSTITTKLPFHPRAELVTGVCESECRELMQQFFKVRR